jgi:hypothetical protein
VYIYIYIYIYMGGGGGLKLYFDKYILNLHKIFIWGLVLD